jgi:hypothetical protein
MLKKLVVGVLLLTLVVIIVVGVIYNLDANDQNDELISKTDEEELTIPNHVSIYLESDLKEGKRMPLIELSVVAGGGCDNASDLKIDQVVNDSDIEVRINGYIFKEGAGQICPAVITESEKLIELDPSWISDKKKKIRFILAGQVNEYNIYLEKYILVLEPTNVSNVVTTKIGYGPQEEPEKITEKFYPADVGMLYVSGSIDSNKDYRPDLRKFANRKNLTLAEKIYQGLEQDSNTAIYIVSDSILNNEHSRKMGTLSSDSLVEVNMSGI